MAQVPPYSGIRRSISFLFWSTTPAKLCWVFGAVLRNLIPRNLILGSESESEVAQSCPTLPNPIDCSLPGSSTHGLPLPSPSDLLGFPKTLHWVQGLAQGRRSIGSSTRTSKHVWPWAISLGAPSVQGWGRKLGCQSSARRRQPLKKPFPG